MGDRANLTLKYDEGEVNVYVHWLGSELPKIIAKALDRQERWDDPQYLARIIVSEIIREAGIDSALSVGIMPDNRFGEGGPVVDLVANTVTLEGYWGGDSSEDWSDVVPEGTYSFSEYIKLITDSGR